MERVLTASSAHGAHVGWSRAAGPWSRVACRRRAQCRQGSPGLAWLSHVGVLGLHTRARQGSPCPTLRRDECRQCRQCRQ
jgi:hypothetical protein